MKPQKMLTIIIPTLIIIFLAIGFFTASNDNGTPAATGTPQTRAITVFVDEEPNNPNNLKEIKIATVEVSLGGELKVNHLTNDSSLVARLNTAVTEINNRQALKLNVENEEMINGEKALVMKEIGVLKTDSKYIYAVRETLAVEFGFKAEIEK